MRLRNSLSITGQTHKKTDVNLLNCIFHDEQRQPFPRDVLRVSIDFIKTYAICEIASIGEFTLKGKLTLVGLLISRYNN